MMSMGNYVVQYVNVWCCCYPFSSLKMVSLMAEINVHKICNSLCLNEVCVTDFKWKVAAKTTMNLHLRMC